MPTFSVQSQRSESNEALEVCLEEDEAISDDVLALIRTNERHIAFTKFGNKSWKSSDKYFKNSALTVTCSAEALGRINPVSITFSGRLEDLDDSVFAKCDRIESIWFGASCRQLFASVPTNLMANPIKCIKVNGWGLVDQGEGLVKLIESVKASGGKYEYYV